MRINLFILSPMGKIVKSSHKHKGLFILPMTGNNYDFINSINVE